MKTARSSLVCWCACMLSGWIPGSMLGEECPPGISMTGTIKGTARLTNTNREILDILCGPPGEGQGFNSQYVGAVSVDHDPFLQAYVSIDSVKSCVEADFEIEVEACTEDGSGIAYSVWAGIYLDARTEWYLFAPRTSVPVTPQETIELPPLEESVGMLDIRWVDKDGNSKPVTGGEIAAFRETEWGDWEYQALKWSIADGTDREFLAVRGGGRYKVVVLYEKGRDDYSDKVRCAWETIIDVPPDTIVQVDCEACEESFGTIVGQVDFLGKDEHSLGIYTLVEARNGPFDNQRLDSLAATPSSGAFELENLVASAIQGYSVHAEMRFGLDRRFQAFRTPCLGIDNPPALVEPASATDLGDTFVVDPGVARGSIVLAGPPGDEERTGACLEDIYRASDTPGATPGLPRDFMLYYDYLSPDMSPEYYYFQSSGVLACGDSAGAGTAKFSSAGGFAMALFEGEFKPAAGRFEGDYELALGGLNREPSFWRPNRLELVFQDTDTPDDPESYQNGNLQILNERISAEEMSPGRTLEVPHHYCFGQVYLCLYSTTGKFHTPHIRYSQGRFEGEDFEGNPAKYQVLVGGRLPLFGTPLESAEPSNLGLVVLCLPQGKYTLDPWVAYEDGSQVQLPPFDLEVGCGQVQKVCNIFWIELDEQIARADSAETVTVSGQVHCDENVTKISYVHEFEGGDDSGIVCPKDTNKDCGINPHFDFDVTLRKGENKISVMAEATIDGRPFTTSVTEATKLTYFKRGDSNADDKLDISDAEHMLGYFYKGGAVPTCLDAADANDDGALNVTDAVCLLLHLFQGGAPILPPSVECGPGQESNELSCGSHEPCE